MDAQTNVKNLRRAFEEWDHSKASNIDMWKAYTTEDMCMRSIGRGRYGLNFSCSRDGQKEMMSYLQDLTDAFEMQHWTLNDTIAEGDRVVGLGVCAWTYKGTGKTVETPIVIICRFRDGLICEYDEYFDTAAVSAATV